ncbi:hypothetical protein CLV30_101216 [Haloactinopolyspora alba]|uniref:CopC domain-containing protein n=1 Tax=Haloactinopolyspora alba TaxID=648780 RepID=A0A2P8EFK1_9ACTN|nr:hypothetical protein CLV30_101216 [Haloactinopolyspora alba]
MRSRFGSAAAAVTTAAAAAALTVAGTLPASAHDVLVGASPADGATVARAPEAVELTFNNAIQNRFAQIAVLDADGGSHQQGEPRVSGPTVTQPVDDLPNGAYTISYRIVSSDGHPVSGTTTFTVAGSGGATDGGAGDATTPGTPDPGTTADATPDDPDRPATGTTPAPTSGSTSAPASAPPEQDTSDAAGTGSDDDGPGPLVVALVIVGAAAVIAGIAYVAVGGRRTDTSGDTGR